MSEQATKSRDHEESGTRADKSTVFEYELGGKGNANHPQIPPDDGVHRNRHLHTPNLESFICTIDNTYAAKKYLNEKGRMDYGTIKPVLSVFPAHQYLKTGEATGKCLSFKRTPEK